MERDFGRRSSAKELFETGKIILRMTNRSVSLKRLMREEELNIRLLEREDVEE